MRWPAIDEAQSGPKRPRRRFVIGDAVVGSVAVEYLDALREFPHAVEVHHDAVRLAVGPGERSAALAEVNARLRSAGLVRAWRDEPYAVVEPGRADVLATIERAASRFWGTLTFGAHANGWVRGVDDRVQTLWIARRSPHKATDPGMHDNLVGGGVPLGQSPHECLLREGWEEAGFTRERMAAAQPGRVIRLIREIPEGLQHEWLSVYDLELQPHEEPRNQDGEVESFTAMPVADALRVAAGGTMTVDASLVTLDFALRHALLPDPVHQSLSLRARGLWAPG